MTDIAETVDTYLAGWNETDPVLRIGIVDSVWAADGRLVDPPLAATGKTEISDMAGSLQSQFPGHHFVRTSEIDQHHGQFRFAWDLVASDGSVALGGIDVGELTEDGSIARITGFFGDLVPREAA